MLKTSKCFIFVILFHTYSITKSQDIILKAQVQIDGKPLIDSRVSFVSAASVTTDQNGYFIRAFPADTKELTIEVPAGLQLMSPADAKIDLGSGRVFQILFTRSSKKSEASKEFSQLAQAIVTSAQSAEQINRSLGLLVAKFDEMHKEDFDPEERKLFQENERRRLALIYAKDNLLPLITGSFDHYISRTRDLRDEFKRRGNKLFNDVGTNITEINKRITAYSEAYEELNKSRSKFVADISIYWSDPYLKMSIENLMATALDKFHKTQVLNYNIMLDDIDNYNQKERGRRRKPEIQNDIQKYIDMLSQNIDVLERDKAAVVQQLFDYKGAW